VEDRQTERESRKPKWNITTTASQPSGASPDLVLDKLHGWDNGAVDIVHARSHVSPVLGLS